MVRHTCHILVYILWLILIYTVLQCLIYFRWYVCTSFRILHVSSELSFWGVNFWKNCNEVILQSTFEARIWFLTVTFGALIIIVQRIKGWFLINFFLPLFLKTFSVGVNLHSDCTLIEKKPIFYFLPNHTNLNNQYVDGYISWFYYFLLKYVWWIVI